jgi:hypothetical protein
MGSIGTALAVLGTRTVLRRRDGWVTVAAPALYFLAETAVYMRGAYSSGGYSRFLVPLAPWLAVLAAAGAQPLLFTRRPAIRLRTALATGVVLVGLWITCEIEWLWNPPRPGPLAGWLIATLRIAAGAIIALLIVALFGMRSAGWHHRRTPSWRFATALAIILLAAPALYGYLPHRLNEQQRIMSEAIPEFHQQGWDDRPLIAVNYWIYYWSDRWVPARLKMWRDAIADAPPGTLFVWDDRFCPEPDENLPLSALDNMRDWSRVWESRPEKPGRGPFLVVLERQTGSLVKSATQ